MQDLGPDMEDLLRKASENYPLKQTEDKWNDIASKLSGEPMPVVPVRTKAARNKKYLAASLFLLLFLFFGLIILKRDEPGKPMQKDIVEEVSSLPKMEKRKKNQDATTISSNGKAGNHPVDVDKSVADNVKTSIISKAVKQHSQGLSLTGVKRFYTEKDVEDDIDQRIEMAKVMPPNISSDSPGGIGMDSYRNKSLVMPQIFSTDEIKHLTDAIDSAKKKKASNVLPKKGIYYGVIAGPGVNTIEKQALKKAGVNIGVLAGYQINQALSIETGMVLSQKFYSTSAAHFSMKVIGLAMPSGMSVMEIDGSTRVIEIPVNLRYSIFQNSKRKVFSLAGVSSYIVDKESNKYHMSMNGAAEMMYATYKSNKAYFISSINLGIGYEQKLGNRNTIRFQPYVQLPIKGIGIGDLHVLSTGFYIGITRTAH